MKFAETLVKKLEHATPAERDPHTRVDLTFLVDFDCPDEFREEILNHDTGTFPKGSSSFMLGAPFLTAEFKILDDKTTRTVALHQWAVEAYINLSMLVDRRLIGRTLSFVCSKSAFSGVYSVGLTPLSSTA